MKYLVRFTTREGVHDEDYCFAKNKTKAKNLIKSLYNGMIDVYEVEEA